MKALQKGKVKKRTKRNHNVYLENYTWNLPAMFVLLYFSLLTMFFFVCDVFREAMYVKVISCYWTVLVTQVFVFK